MNELDRFIKLPLEINIHFQEDLRRIYYGVVLKGRRATSTQDILNAVREGYSEWRKVIWGRVNRESNEHPLSSAFMRTLLIAIPDVFVVAYAMKVFGEYKLDSAEQEVHDVAKSYFESKLKLAKMFDALPLELRILNTLKEAHPPVTAQESRWRWTRPDAYDF